MAKMPKQTEKQSFFRKREIRRLTSTIWLRAVSEPMEKSVPGTLLLIVAGRMHIGIQNSGYCGLLSAKTNALLNACK